MLHTKLLTQRRPYVPWLLAAGLALGWSGEAAAQADYLLSVNPNNVREDAGATEIAITVEVTNDTAVEADTYVLLSLSSEGLNSRFFIGLTTLMILAGEKRATETLTLIPINDDIADEDLPIVISGNAGGGKTVESATIALIDDDKESSSISLSADIVELNRFDGATEITVTATLDGKVLNEETSFALTIGDHPDLTNDPNTDTDGDGDIDAADATKDNREAERDLDYTATLPTLTIPSNAVSGTATIVITPRSRLPGTIRVGSPDSDTDADAPGIQIEDDGLTLHPVDIKIKKEIAATADAITLSHERIREDAGETAIELKVSLTEPLVEDETVRLTVLPTGAVLPSGATVTNTPTRDVNYKLVFGPPFIIPAGATEGTTTLTITPINDTDVVQRGAIYIQVTVGAVLATRTIVIADDDSNSMNIALTVDPATISEGDGATDVVVTGTLDGKVFDANVFLILTIDSDPKDTDANGNVVDVVEATRDIDYVARMRPLTIPAGSVSGTTTITITPDDDKSAEGDEIIRVTVPYDNNQISAQYADGAAVELTVSTVDITLKDTGAGGVPSFADVAIDAQTYVVGTAIADWVLPEASGGDGALTYSVSTLPAGLDFDAATRTLGGTPTESTVVEVTYTATDDNSVTATLTFTITVNPAPRVAPAGLTAVPAVIREDAAATEVSLTFTLGAAATSVEIVRFTIVDPSEGTAATRDVDYTARLSAIIIIPVGATEGTTTLTLTPIDDEEEEGIEALGVRATLISTNETLATDIELRDDETPSTSIALSADPSTLSENDDLTVVTVTATLDGKALEEDATVRLAIDDESSATRDLDYAALFTPMIEIPAGSITGTVDFYVDPVADNLEEGDEIIRLIGTIDGLEGGEVEITLSDPGASEAAKAAVQTRPEAFALADNFPNPFNPTTTIKYALPQAADVELTVYNVVGQPVRTLIAEYQSAGRYAVEWDATNDSGHRLSSGMYFYRLQAGGEFVEVKKMLLLK